MESEGEQVVRETRVLRIVYPAEDIRVLPEDAVSTHLERRQKQAGLVRSLAEVDKPQGLISKGHGECKRKKVDPLRRCPEAVIRGMICARKPHAKIRGILHRCWQTKPASPRPFCGKFEKWTIQTPRAGTEFTASNSRHDRREESELCARLMELKLTGR